MANVAKETCPKCGGEKGRDFKILGKHLRYCKGKKAAKKPERDVVLQHTDVSTGQPRQAVTDDPILGLLQSRRQELIDTFIKSNPEVARLDTAIVALGGRPS